MWRLQHILVCKGWSLVWNTSVPTPHSPKSSFNPTYLTKGFPLGMVEKHSQQVILWSSSLLRWRKCALPAAQTSSHLNQDLARLSNHEADGSEGNRWCPSDTVLGIFSSFFLYCKAFFLPQLALKYLISSLITTPMLCPSWPLLAGVLSLPSLVNMILCWRSARSELLPLWAATPLHPSQWLFLFRAPTKLNCERTVNFQPGEALH